MPSPSEGKRSLSFAYLMCALGFFGFAGIHRFYLGKPVTGLLWFITGGFLGLGTIWDLITLPDQVAIANLRALPPPPVRPLPAQVVGVLPPPAAPDPDPELDLEIRVLRAARKHGGRLSTPVAAAELAVTIADAEEQLDEIAKAGHANVEVNEDGVVYYDFPALRI